MMLQQTQVPRVLQRYRSFLRKFPTLRALSNASSGQVITEWQGLGYNRRALWLHRIAKTLVSGQKGRFPDSYDRLRALPGIGDYTARAILVFAFRKQEPVLDVNIRRVIARLTKRPSESITIEVARAFLPRGRAFEWNQAMMDLGSIYCTARRPDCGACPVAASCLSAGRVAPPAGGPPKKEPGRHGVPRRIYRGRILRQLTARSPLSARALALRIGLPSTEADLRWLSAIVRRLDAEGLVKYEIGPSAWKVRRVA